VPTGAPSRIVVADDDPDIADFLTIALEDCGYRVQTVYNGEEARDVTLRTLPDLVVLDWMMPKMDGIEVLTALRAHAQTRDIPVVLLTAKVSDGEVWEGWQAGADYYMTKPFDLDELLRYLTLRGL
jgi:DNA-binding response OmpR family regulator